jgi:hypothetical protein
MEVRNTILIGKPEGKRPLVRPKHRCDNILKWILNKYSGSGQSPVTSCEHDSEPACSTEGREQITTSQEGLWSMEFVN